MQRAACPARVGEPVAHFGGFVRGEVVEHDVDRELARHAAVDLLAERQHVGAGMALAQRVADLARLDVERGEQVGRAVALVVVRHRGRPALLQRQPGCVRSSACTCVFSSTQSTTALLGWI